MCRHSPRLLLEVVHFNQALACEVEGCRSSRIVTVESSSYDPSKWQDGGTRILLISFINGCNSKQRQKGIHLAVYPFFGCPRGSA